jgi:DNA-binding SARP family transcriptional activator
MRAATVRADAELRRSGATTRRGARPPARWLTARVLAADVFDQFPNAIMVCDRGGRVVAANTRFRAHTNAAVGETTCCSLLGCLRPGTGLDTICVTAEVLARGAELSDLPVELAAGRFRVSAAPLYEDFSHVIVELRRENREGAAPGSLRLFTLGRLRVETGEGELAGDWLDGRPGQLLRFLACQRHNMASSDAIAEAIWPQAGPSAENSVRHFVHVLRARLEPQRGRGVPSAYVVRAHGGYALAKDRIWIDADEFESAVRLGLTALAVRDQRAAERHLERAARLYRDDFLADEPYAEWALGERERLRAKACAALRALADLRRGPVEAAACLERLAEMEPFDTDVHRRLIATWLSLGRRSRAARHYQLFRRRLMREFGELPGFELAELSAHPPRPT